MTFGFIEAEKACLPISRMCRALGVSQSGFFAWQDDYNHHRPHSGIGNIPPVEFAEKNRMEMRAD